MSSFMREDGPTPVEPTPEQIAEAAAYWQSRTGQADRLSQRAQRLFRLARLNAPEIVIEQARRLVFKSLMTFPIDPEGSKSADEVAAAIAAEESAFLQQHGYYDDIDPIPTGGTP